MVWNEIDDANYAYNPPDKFPTVTNQRAFSLIMDFS